MVVTVHCGFLLAKSDALVDNQSPLVIALVCVSHKLARYQTAKSNDGISMTLVLPRNAILSGNPKHQGFKSPA